MHASRLLVSKPFVLATLTLVRVAFCCTPARAGRLREALPAEPVGTNSPGTPADRPSKPVTETLRCRVVALVSRRHSGRFVHRRGE